MRRERDEWVDNGKRGPIMALSIGNRKQSISRLLSATSPVMAKLGSGRRNMMLIRHNAPYSNAFFILRGSCIQNDIYIFTFRNGVLNRKI